MEIKLLRDEYIDKTKKLRSSLRILSSIARNVYIHMLLVSRVNIINKFSIERAAHEITYLGKNLYKIIFFN